MTKILFICHGNICRSPMAEFVMKALVRAAGRENEFYIESAAVSTEEIGNGIYPPARRCLSQHGVLFDQGKRARQVTVEDYLRFDRLVVMDRSNIRWMERILSRDPRTAGDPAGKVHMLMAYTGFSRDVDDPWYSGDFETCFQDILEGCQEMLKQM